MPDAPDIREIPSQPVEAPSPDSPALGSNPPLPPEITDTGDGRGRFKRFLRGRREPRETPPQPPESPLADAQEAIDQIFPPAEKPNTATGEPAQKPEIAPDTALERQIQALMREVDDPGKKGRDYIARMLGAEAPTEENTEKKSRFWKRLKTSKVATKIALGAAAALMTVAGARDTAPPEAPAPEPEPIPNPTLIESAPEESAPPRGIKLAERPGLPTAETVSTDAPENDTAETTEDAPSEIKTTPVTVENGSTISGMVISIAEQNGTAEAYKFSDGSINPNSAALWEDIRQTFMASPDIQQLNPELTQLIKEAETAGDEIDTEEFRGMVNDVSVEKYGIRDGIMAKPGTTAEVVAEAWDTSEV